MRKTTVMILITFVCFAIQPLNAFAAPTLIGEVAGAGKAEVLIFGDDWSRVERSYPVFAKSRYRTSDGTLSFLLKDGTRLDVGNNSEVIVEGAEGEYSVLLLDGEVAFNVPEDSTLRVRSSGTTVGAGTVIAKNGVITPGGVAGAVKYDGVNTTASAVKGALSVASSNETTTLAEGENMVVSAAGKSVEGATAAEGAGNPGNDGKKAELTILGFGLFTAGAIALAVGGDDGGVASPSSP